MTPSKLLEQSREQRIGKKPVVVLPLAVWRELENRLEDLIMLESKKLKSKIAKARSEKKLYSACQLKKVLGF